MKLLKQSEIPHFKRVALRVLKESADLLGVLKKTTNRYVLIFI